MVYVITVAVLWVLAKLLYGFRVVGKQNLINDRPFLICPNHQSLVDVVMVVLSRLPQKKLVIMGKHTLFKNPLLGWFFRKLGAFPVHRGTGDVEAVNMGIEEVKKGRGMLLFPEGTRSKDGNLLRFKSGAFVIAQAAGADIIPCRIIYKGGKTSVFHRCTVIYGEPIPIADLNLEGASAANLRAAKELLKGRIEALLEANREYC